MVEATERPGRYEAPAPYAGYIQFPAPLTLAQFSRIWREIYEPLADLTPLQLGRFHYEYDGGRLLLLEYGSFVLSHGDRVYTRGDFTDQAIPLDLSSWIGDCFSEYVVPKVGRRRQLSINAL